MAKFELKAGYRVRSKGVDYYYAWKGRGAPRLYSKPGSAAFLEELHAALAARQVRDETRVSSLCARYRASSDFLENADSTKREWGRWIDLIEEHFGSLSIRQFDKPSIRVDIRRWRDKWKDRPRAADYGKQVLSRIMSFAVAEGVLAINPVTGIPNLYHSDRSGIIWTDEDLARLFESCSPEIAWAGKLGAMTGLRQADLLRLTWDHVKPLSIEIVTGKSRRRPKTAIIPLHSALRNLLDEIPRRGPTILTNTRRKGWRSGFGDSWRDAVAAAGISGLHFHDLRGTAATKLYQADMTEREIAQILGWSEKEVEKLLELYVKKDEMLLDRIRRMDRAAQREGEDSAV